MVFNFEFKILTKMNILKFEKNRAFFQCLGMEEPDI